MLSRLVGWVINTPLHDAQRDLIKEQTRRLRLKTDIQEKRINDRKLDNAPKLSPVAKISIKMFHDERETWVSWILFQTNHSRSIGPGGIRIAIKGESGFWNRLDFSDLPYVVNFVKKNDYYQLGLQSWLCGEISLEDLKLYAEDDDKVTLKNVADIINKKKD